MKRKNYFKLATIFGVATIAAVNYASLNNDSGSSFSVIDIKDAKASDEDCNDGGGAACTYWVTTGQHGIPHRVYSTYAE